MFVVTGTAPAYVIRAKKPKRLPVGFSQPI
jgi:hypothetical protein